jgi:hypothetical protein
MMSALAAKLGVAMPEADTRDPVEPSNSADDARVEPTVATEAVFRHQNDITPSDPAPNGSQRQTTTVLQPRHHEPAVQEMTAAPVIIDGRIIAARGKQPLYVRLPREMHEFLEDLSYRLSKTNRDASMTNLVAQAIVDKYPDSLQVTDKTE